MCVSRTTALSCFVIIAWLSSGNCRQGTANIQSHSSIKDEASKRSDRSIEEVTQLFLNCPSYRATESSDPQTKAKIMEVLDRISKYDDDSIVGGIQNVRDDLLKGNCPKDDIVYLLIRYMFDPPEWMPIDHNIFGGWFNRPVDKEHNRVNMIWPFKVDGEKGLVLSERIGGYNGPPYQGIADFHYYRTTFPRRRH